MDMDNHRRLGIIKFIFVVVFLAVAGSAFTFNLDGFPNLNTSTTLDCGANMTCSQVGTIINIDSNGSGFGSENDPISMANISTNFADWSDEYDGSWLNSSYGKINKTGDNMTGNLNMGGYNVSNITFTTSVNFLGLNPNSTSSPFYETNNAKSGLGTDYIGQFISEGNAAEFILTSYGNDSVWEGSGFKGIRYRGNFSNPLPILANDQLFAVNGRGWYGGSSVSGSKVALVYISAENWDAANQGTLIDFYTTRIGTTTTAKAFRIENDKNVTVYGLSGSGNAYACIDSTGKLYRGTPTC